MSREELLDIGIKFRGGAFPNETWETLNIKYNKPFASGESFRSFVKKELKKQNKLPSKESINKIHNDLNDKDFEQDYKNNYKSTIELNKDGSQTSDKLLLMSEEECKDVSYLLKSHGYDVITWELVSARNNIWNVYSKQDGIQTLYSSKIVVKPRIDSISLDEIRQHFKQFSKEYKKPTIKEHTYKNTGKLLEIPIMDLHLGKLGWAEEVGINYDHKIAEDIFMQVVSDFINRTKYYEFDKILFPIGQDFFNFDSLDGSTTKGTRQDNDLRWQKLYLKGVEILVKAVDLLSEIAPVEVFYVAGNHDKMTSYYATNYLYAWYHNDKNVIVDVNPKARKYVEYGNCLIGYSHGSEERKNIYGIMQVEAREAWGRTLYHEWHLGHLHSEHTTEEKGIIVRNISSITGSDAWHCESGYVGAIRKAQAFVWDKEYGLTDIINSIIK